MGIRICLRTRSIKTKNVKNDKKDHRILWFLLPPLLRKSSSETVNAANIKKTLAKPLAFRLL
jgi:hypothetical protein